MPAQWTAVIIGQLHLNSITAKELAAEVGWHPKYLSRVLNGSGDANGADEKLTAALNRIIERKAQSEKPIHL